jgi:hypothetical protein
MILGNCPLKLAFCACLLTSSCLMAADPPAPGKGWQFGARLEFTPLRSFKTSTVDSSTTTPVADYEATTKASDRKANVALTLERRFSQRFSLGADARFEPVQYTQTTRMWSGRVDPNSSYDDRVASIFTEASKLDYLEIPVLARYYLPGNGWYSKAYILGGIDYRRVVRLRTTNTYNYADGVVVADRNPVTPNKPSQVGWVVGVGLRFVDDFNLKTMPEVRFVRWTSPTFQGMSYRSSQNQIEVGIGFSF